MGASTGNGNASSSTGKLRVWVLTCRHNTITIVGGLSPKFHVTSLVFPFFWQTGWRLAIFTNIDTRASLAMASLPPPTAGRRPFRCNALVSHIMGDSPPPRFDQIHRGGGDLHNNSPGQFEGVFAATTWGNRHCLYRHPRPEDARSGAAHLLKGVMESFFWLVRKHTTINLILCVS
jgi:hypothetical protein